MLKYYVLLRARYVDFSTRDCNLRSGHDLRTPRFKPNEAVGCSAWSVFLSLIILPAKYFLNTWERVDIDCFEL
jgi:hypothetical protein